MAKKKNNSGWGALLLLGMAIGSGLGKSGKPNEDTQVVQANAAIESPAKEVVELDVQTQDLSALVSKSNQSHAVMEDALDAALNSTRSLAHLSLAVEACYEDSQSIASYYSTNQSVNDAALSFSNMALMRCNFYKKALATLEETPQNDWTRAISELSAQSNGIRESISAQAEEGRRLLLVATAKK